MTKRQEKFLSLRDDAHYSKLFNKLSIEDRHLMYRFILENENLNRDEFVFKVNRMFLDKEKPKNFKFILEFLTVVG